MNVSVREFLREEDGITALEYGILAALIATLLVSVFGPGISGVFTKIMTALSAAVDSATA
ncbi:Pilin [Rhodanobacter sp. Root179]|jgi:pilus assembly protein Flp/PilA|uniref:Flp family type IVb pilin n=1 Tax=unclassified Rhodanobacter TaxID=2621553 RepID=UPI000700A601|nr:MULTISPECIES: Flp family type IVb pilin [unclassified Rhodanobacter]KQZ80262.1 pilin [Rhodanobacter sp. Root561]KRB40824.1 pilin [Rhodanobacter sp. Root179]